MPPSIDQHKNILNQPAVGLNVMRELSEGSTKASHIIHKYVASSGLHSPLKLRARNKPFHGISASMVHPRRLNDIGVSRCVIHKRADFGKNLWNSVIARSLFRVRSYKDVAFRKPGCCTIDWLQGKGQDKAERRPDITSLCRDIRRMLLEFLVRFKQVQRRYVTGHR